MEANKTTYPKRRIYFIEKGFQSKFILKFCLIVILGGILTVGLLYLLSLGSTTIAVVNSRVAVRTTADFILPLLIQTVAVVSIVAALITIILTLFISHKIAGPLYRFKKVFKELAEGNFSDNFKIRKLDQLQMLAEEFNSMIVTTREKINSVKKEADALNGYLNALDEKTLPEEKRSLLKEIKNKIAGLNLLLKHFKT